MTGQAAKRLTELLQFNIPPRWSIAHLYQAILNKGAHIGNISHLTTLAGFVHWKLTGRKVLGVGEASGMSPMMSSPRMRRFPGFRLLGPCGFLARTLRLRPLRGSMRAARTIPDSAMQSPPTEQLRDFAEMAGIEFLLIDENTRLHEFKKELRWNDLYYYLKNGI